jgi:FkbM family methyltransferase
MFDGGLEIILAFINNLYLVLKQNGSVRYKLRVLLSYYLFSRNKIIRIFGYKLNYERHQKAHVLSILREIWIENSYELSKKTQDIISLSGSHVIVDIGANIGLSTVYFRSKYPHIKIISIEASPINYAILIKNIELNNAKDVIPLNLFVSDNSNIQNFYHNTMKSGSSFGEGFKDLTNLKLKKFKVQSESLSNLLVAYPSLVIKIDVEGAEYLILKDLFQSPVLSKIHEIIVEVSTRSHDQFKKLIAVIEVYSNEGFEIRIKSDFTGNQSTTNGRQNHFLLNLIRS